MCIHTQLCMHSVYEFVHKYCGLQIPCSIPLGGVHSYNCCTLGLPNQPMPDFNRVRIRSSVVIFPIAYLAPWTIHAFLHSHLQKTYTSCLRKNGLSMTRTRQTPLAQWESALRAGIICDVCHRTDTQNAWIRWIGQFQKPIPIVHNKQITICCTSPHIWMQPIHLSPPTYICTFMHFRSSRPFTSSQIGRAHV